MSDPTPDDSPATPRTSRTPAPARDFLSRATTTYIHDRQLVDRFAEAAAARFAERPDLRTFSDGAIDPDLLAIRWGLHDRAVLVLRIDAGFQPLIYCDLVPEAEADSSAQDVESVKVRRARTRAVIR